MAEFPMYLLWKLCPILYTLHNYALKIKFPATFLQDTFHFWPSDAGSVSSSTHANTPATVIDTTIHKINV